MEMQDTLLPADSAIDAFESETKNRIIELEQKRDAVNSIENKDRQYACNVLQLFPTSPTIHRSDARAVDFFLSSTASSDVQSRNRV
jgi:hypothetical protein